MSLLSKEGDLSRGISRRNFLRFGAASLVVTAINAACRRALEPSANTLPPATDQATGIPPTGQPVIVAPEATAHITATQAFLATERPTATPDISTYQANIDRYIKGNPDLTAQQIEQYTARLAQIRANPAELAAYNSAAEQLIADATVLSVENLIPAPEAMTVIPAIPVFAIWRFDSDLNKWVNFSQNYQTEQPTQPGLRVMMAPPIDDPLYHWSDRPLSDRAFVVPPPQGTNVAAGEFDYDTFGFIAEVANNLPLLPDSSKPQILIPVLYKNGQIVAKQQATKLYQDGIPVTEQVERNESTITRSVYRREWTHVENAQPTPVLQEQATPLETALAEIQSTQLFSETVTVDGIPYNFQLSQVPFVIGDKTYHVVFQENPNNGNGVDFVDDYLKPVAELISSNDVIFGVDASQTEPTIQPISISSIVQEYGSVIIEQCFVDFHSSPDALTSTLASYFYGRGEEEGEGDIFIVVNENKITLVTIIPDRAVTQMEYLPAYQLHERLAAGLSALTISEEERAQMVEESNGKNLVAHQFSDIAALNASLIHYPDNLVLPDDLAEAQAILTRDDVVSFTITSE